MRTVIILIATLALIAAAAPAAARDSDRPGESTRVETVAYGDLDLTNASDVARLRRRVAAATETVCGSYAQSSDAEAYEITRCRREVKTRVDQQLARLINARDARYAGASDR
jgi:UrcA family protein